MTRPLWIAACVLLSVALGLGAAYATRLRRVDRDRLSQIDKFCGSKITSLRFQATHVRELAPTDDYVQVVLGATDWVYFRLCTSDDQSVKFAQTVRDCKSSRCLAAALDQLADDVEGR